MTKVCTHGRDKTLALRMLDESLHRLRTDHLDLWQIHGVRFEYAGAVLNGSLPELTYATHDRSKGKKVSTPVTLEQAEQSHILQTLQQTEGVWVVLMALQPGLACRGQP